MAPKAYTDNCPSNLVNYELERQFEALNHHAIVSIADVRGNITYVNAKFCEVSGYSPDELLGVNHRLVKSGQHPDSFFQEMWRTISSGQIWNGEICNRRKDGSLYWVESTITPFIDDTGKPYQYVSIRTDITHLHEVQTTLESQVGFQRCLTQMAQSLISAEPHELHGTFCEIVETVAGCIDSQLSAIYLWQDNLFLDQSYISKGSQAPSDKLLKSILGNSRKLKERTEKPHILESLADQGVRTNSSLDSFTAIPLIAEGSNLGLLIVDLCRVPEADRKKQQDLFLILAELLAQTVIKSDQTEQIIKFKERLRQGQVYANIGTWEWNILNGDLYWSEKIPPLFGYTEGETETSYENFINAVHPEDRELVENAIEKTLKYDLPYEVEHRIITQEGEVRWLLEKGAVIRDAEGNPHSMLGVVQDINEKKIALVELERAASDLNRAQRIAHVGSWKVNPRTGEVTWSEEAYRIFGFKPFSISLDNRLLYSLIHPEDFPRFRDHERAIKENGTYRIEYRIIRNDGETRWVKETAKVELDEFGEKKSYSGTVQDITDQVLAERKIRETETRFALAIQGSGDAVWDWDTQTNYFSFDANYLTLCGYEPGELPNHIDALYDIIHVDDRNDLKSAIADYLSGNITYFHKDVRLVRKNGEVKWVLVRISIVENDNGGEATRVVGILSDIDYLKKTQEALTAAQKEAERANQAKSQFLSHMSHELRTPLNSILGFSQLLELNEELEEEDKESVAEIKKSGRHLLTLINDILDLSKIEAGKLTLSIEQVSLGGVINESASLIKPLLESGNIKLKVEQKGDDTVIADKMRLKQVLLNLLSNAVKYNKKAGTVTITTENLAEGRVRVSVSDEGKGIDSANIEKLFTPFDRLDEETSFVEGTGIGLSITKNLVEMMNGDIYVSSKIGEGTVFSIELPQPLLSNNTSDQDSFESLIKGECYESLEDQIILYIDDNPSNLKLVRSILSRFPYLDLIDTDDPEAGLRIAQEVYPDLIIVDINMPHIDGYQVLEIIRRNPCLDDVPLIALSANATDKDISKALSKGFSDYMTKPIDIENFTSKLVELIGQKVV